MGRFDFSNPGAVAGMSIATLLAQREEQARKQAELELQQKEAEARIASQKASDAIAKSADERATKAEAAREESDAVVNASRIRDAMARGDMLTPDQMGALDKGHLGSTFDRFGGKKLDAAPITATPDGSIAQGPMVQGAPDASVPAYGVAKATPRDLERDSDRETKETLARDAIVARAEAARLAAQQHSETVAQQIEARKEIAQLQAGTTAAIANLHIGEQQQRDQDKKDAAAKTEATRQKGLSDSANETLNAIDQLVVTDPKTNQPTLAPGVGTLVGGMRVPGILANSGMLFGDAAKAKGNLDNLKSRLVVDLIGQMKAQSRTGATGFGQLSDKERVLLENSASKLDKTNMSEADFLNELLRIREKVSKVAAPAIDFRQDHQ